jgi:DNA replication protein DnaC
MKLLPEILIDLTFIRQKGNLIFWGPPGVGKPHLAVSLAWKACHAGMILYLDGRS